MKVARSAARNSDKECFARKNFAWLQGLRDREKEDMVGGHAVALRETMLQRESCVGQAADKTAHCRATWRAGCPQHDEQGKIQFPRCRSLSLICDGV
jgi:hypothetical protein